MGDDVPDDLSGGYERVPLDGVTVNADAAVLYATTGGRNYRTGSVVSLEVADGGTRVALTDDADPQVERLVVDPPAPDADADRHAVVAETEFRTERLGEFLALYARG